MATENLVKVDMSGKVCLVTGANTGIGRVTAVELARAGATVILACRSRERAEGVIQEITAATSEQQAVFIPLDLGRFESVRACADAVLARDEPLHVLINNAGLAGQRGLTPEGFELAFGVNHLGHFLLTLLLMDRLKASAPARIVNVSSRAHYRAKGIPEEVIKNTTATTVGMHEYEISKLANVLFTNELAARLEGTGITTYSLHPGVVASDIWRRVPWPFDRVMKLFMVSNEEGAMTTLHCATSPEAAAETGLYYDSCRPKNPSAVSKDAALARDLWARSLTWTQAPDL